MAEVPEGSTKDFLELWLILFSEHVVLVAYHRDRNQRLTYFISVLLGRYIVPILVSFLLNYCELLRFLLFQYFHILFHIVFDSFYPEEQRFNTVAWLRKVKYDAYTCNIFKVYRAQWCLKQITMDSATSQFVCIYLLLHIFESFGSKLIIKGYGLLYLILRINRHIQHFVDQVAFTTPFVTTEHECL